MTNSLLQNPDDAQKCIDASGKYNLQLDGRHLDAFVAVTRGDLDKQKLEQQKEPKDKRNLFLAREGCMKAFSLKQVVVCQITTFFKCFVVFK